jgi:hypothetical protein
MLTLLITLPQRFQSLGNVSIFSLVDATGYFGLHDQISQADIRAALVRCPECVHGWFQYSEDKRIPSGWFLAENDEGCYETGFIVDACTRTNRMQYDNAIDACAAFIKHELEDMRLT